MNTGTNNSEKNIKAAHSAILAVAALSWGIAFVFQTIGGGTLGPLTFNSFRMLIGALVVYIATIPLDRLGFTKKPKSKEERRKLWIAGIVCGLLLFVASNVQQIALVLNVTTGKAGFVTALYIVFVPIFGLFMHRKCGWNIWISVVIAVIGLYFLCMSESFGFEAADILLLISAVGFALQILMIDRLGSDVDSLRLSVIQFLVTGVTSLFPALFAEIIPYEGGGAAWLAAFFSWKAWVSLLYLGFISCGIGYTFQVIGMKGLNPAVASLIMSLESVFALIAGVLFLGQSMSGRELFGCLLMFIAICLSQITFKTRAGTA